MPVFDYLAQHPDAASHFSEAMVGFHGSEPPTVADAYDFSGVQTVVDVGGASGNMLAALCRAIRVCTGCSSTSPTSCVTHRPC
jgi:hypothetical protein